MWRGLILGVRGACSHDLTTCCLEGIVSTAREPAFNLNSTTCCFPGKVTISLFMLVLICKTEITIIPICGWLSDDHKFCGSVDTYICNVTLLLFSSRGVVSLNLGWTCDLLWQTECSVNDVIWMALQIFLFLEITMLLKKSWIVEREA